MLYSYLELAYDNFNSDFLGIRKKNCFILVLCIYEHLTWQDRVLRKKLYIDIEIYLKLFSLLIPF